MFLATFETLTKQEIQQVVCDQPDQIGSFGGQRSKETVSILRDVAAAPQTPQLGGGARPTLGAQVSRGGVEDTRLEAKAKDTKKIRGQGQGQPFRGQTLSRPRTGMLEAKAKDQGHKRKCSPKKKKKKKKKKVFTKIFQAISTKKRFLKNFSSAPQNFNNSKNSAVLEPRTGQFSRT